MLGILGLIIGILFLIWGAYKRFAAIPLALIASIIVMLTNGLSLWETFSTTFMTGYTSFFINFFLIFIASALFAKVMETTGAALTIGYKFLDWFGPKRAVLVVFLTTAVLTYGGVSLFVVVFAIAPIIMTLFNQVNLPRRFAMAPLLAGAATFTMKSLPGSPSLTNVAPTTFLGTSLDAAPVMGLISAALMITMQLFYFKWEEKRLRASGETFSFIPGTDVSIYQVERSELPSPVISFLPMLTVIVMIIGGSQLNRHGVINVPTGALVILSMLVATTMAVAFNWNRVANKLEILNNGTGAAVSAIAGPAAIIGFGAVVQATPAFTMIVNELLSLQMHPYLMAAIGPSVIAAITASSSGGLLITMEVLSDYFITSGANLDTIHRLTATFSGTFDALPHSTSLFLMFGYLGITVKEGYRFIWWGTVIIPTVAAVIVLVGAILIG